ncbi:MAG: ABC transporter substrate-binding protein [Deltaproteobacteria bacterium]|nr:ABC transporter substrate-binding protein [Deltaproteobacteria bacterium]
MRTAAGFRMAVTALLAVLPALSGCMKEPPDPGSPDDRVVIVLEAAPRDFDPRFVSDASSTKVSRLLFCALTTFETPDLKPALEAAAEIWPACGGKNVQGNAADECSHWVVRLRPDVFWHDGVRVTAHDVVFTYRSILESGLPSPFRGDLQRKISRVFEKDGDVHFILTAPVATFLADLTVGLVPAHVLEPRGGLAATFGDEPVGCGPFRFVSRYGGQKVVLERNDLFFKPVSPRYVVVRTLADEATRVLSVMAGSADIGVNVLSPPVVARLAEDPAVKVLHGPAACTTYLTFNLLDPRLADPRVRQAFALGIDREGIVEDQFHGMGVVADSVLPPMHWAHADGLPRPRFDPEAAAALLDEAGLAPDPATGIRAQFTLKVTTDRFRRNIGVLIAWQLSRIGIEVDLLPLELSTFLADVRKGNFELYILQLPEVTEPDILRWLLHSQAAPVLTPQPGKSRFGIPDRTLVPPGFTQLAGPLAAECRRRWWPRVLRQAVTTFVRGLTGHPAGIGNGNRSFFYDPYLDCMLDLGFLTTDSARRLDFYAEAQRIAARELPVLPLWHEDNVAVVRSDLSGYSLLPINRYAPIVDVQRRSSIR